MNTAHDRRHAISPRQIKAVHATLASLGIDDADYRAMLHERYRAKSCKDLTWRQAEELLKQLNGVASRGVKESISITPDIQNPITGDALCAQLFPQLYLRISKFRYVELDGRPGFCSGAQARMIEAIWARVSRATTDDDREQALWSMMRRICGVDHFRFLEAKKVQSIVKALKVMGGKP
jgi:hypothetical protein